MAPVVGKIDADQARAYAVATNDANRAYSTGLLIPPVSGVVPTWDAFTSTLETVVPGEFMAKLLHLAQDMRFLRPLVPDVVMVSAGEVVRTVVRRAGTQVLVHVATTDADGAPLLDQYGTLFVRGFAGPVIDGGAVPSHAFPAGMRDEAPAAVVKLRVDADQPARYAEASGDRNNVHTDDEFARSLGFPGVIVHGMCTMALCGQAVIEAVAGADPARLARLAVRFARPVLPGDDLQVTIHGPVAGAGAGVYVFEAASRGERVVRDGLAEVRG